METIELTEDQLWIIKTSLDKAIEHNYVDAEKALKVLEIVRKVYFQRID